MSQWAGQRGRKAPQALRYHKPTGSPSRLNRRQLRQLPRLLAPRPGGLRVLRGDLGQAAGGPGHQGAVRSVLSPGPRGPDAQELRLQRQKPALRAPTTVGGRGGHPGLAGAALPTTEKRPSRGQNHPVGRRIRVLPAARIVASLGSGGRDAGNPAQAGHEHLSAISITGELYLAAQDHSYKGPDAIRFLEQLLREIPGKLLLIWDGAPVHCSRAAKEWLSQGASRAHTVGAVARLRPGVEPGRRGMALPEAGGIEELGLRRPGAVAREFWNAAKGLLGKPEVLCACIKEVSYVW